MKWTYMLILVCVHTGCADSPSTPSRQAAEPPVQTPDARSPSAQAPDATTPSAMKPGTWSHRQRLSFGGRSRSYSLYRPKTGIAQGLMVVLHGSGDTVDVTISSMAAEAAADEHGFMLVVPAGIENSWNDEDPPGGELADDVGFIDALTIKIKAIFPEIPSEMVFAIGFSNGGGLATRLACEGNEIRGVGVMGNDYVAAFDACGRQRNTARPGWFGIGTEDDVVSVNAVRDSIPNYVADLTHCSPMGALDTMPIPDLSSDITCAQFSNCAGAQLCVYDGQGHIILPHAVELAWRFLSQAVDAIAQ